MSVFGYEEANYGAFSYSRKVLRFEFIAYAICDMLYNKIMSKSIDFALRHIGEEIPVRLSLDNALYVKVKKGTVIGYNDNLGVLVGFADKSGLLRHLYTPLHLITKSNY